MVAVFRRCKWTGAVHSVPIIRTSTPFHCECNSHSSLNLFSFINIIVMCILCLIRPPVHAVSLWFIPISRAFFAVQKIARNMNELDLIHISSGIYAPNHYFSPARQSTILVNSSSACCQFRQSSLFEIVSAALISTHEFVSCLCIDKCLCFMHFNFSFAKHSFPVPEHFRREAYSVFSSSSGHKYLAHTRNIFCKGSFIGPLSMREGTRK